MLIWTIASLDSTRPSVRSPCSASDTCPTKQTFVPRSSVSATPARSENNDGRKLNPQRRHNRNSLQKTDGQSISTMTKPQRNTTIFQRQGAPVAQPVKLQVVGSSRRAFVPLDQPTESLVADDLIENDRLVFPRRIGAGGRQEISGRVRAVVVVITGIFTYQIVEMLLAKNQEVVQAFLFYTLHDRTWNSNWGSEWGGGVVLRIRIS